MAIEQVRGQGLALSRLDQLIKKGIPPALLFVGPSGVGKKTAAVRFAAEASGIPFRRVESGNSVDVRVYDGEELKVADAREIERQLHWKPTAAEKRFAIIDHAERMSAATYNTLLKILEEPPSTSHIILISESTNSVPMTIRSRCHVVTFSLLSTEEVFLILTEDMKMAEKSAQPIASMSEGSMEKAMWGFRGIYREDLSLVSGIITSLRAGNLESAFVEVERWSSRTDILRRIYMMYLYFRDCFVLKDSRLFPLPNADIPIRAVTMISTRLQAAHEAIAANANTKLILTNLMLDIAALVK